MLTPVHASHHYSRISLGIAVVSVVLSALFSIPGTVHRAQAEVVALQFNLHRGSIDATTNGDVTRLQQFLAQDPSIYPEQIISGFYGALTEKAVQRFQYKKGISTSGTPATTGYGSVGPRTRAVINASLGTNSTFSVSAQNVVVPRPKSGSETAVASIQTIGSIQGNTLSLSQSALPYGVTSNISSCQHPCSTIQTITVSSYAKEGTYPVTLTASTGTATTNTTYTISIGAPVAFDFLVGNSGDVTITQPVSGTASISNSLNISRLVGSAEPLTISQGPLPRDVSISSNTTNCTPNPTCTITNTFTIKTTAPPGTYLITATTTAGVITKKTQYNLIIKPAPPFGFHLTNSGNLTVERPRTGVTSINNSVDAILDGGAPASITLVQSGLPSGVSASASALTGCTLPCSKSNILTISSGAATGTFPIEIASTVNGIRSTTNYTLTIKEYVPFVFGLSNSGPVVITRPISGSVSASNAITAITNAGTPKPITFIAKGMPTGAGYTLGSCTPNCTSNNLITINETTPLGTYSILVEGSSSGLSTTTTSFQLQVK